MARNITNGDRITLPSGAALMNESAFSIITWFRTSKTAEQASIYWENNAFNKQMFYRTNITTGYAVAFYRTPTDIVNISGTTDFADGAWHWMFFNRSASNAFELFVDGVSQATSTVNPGVDASTMTIEVGSEPGSAIRSIDGDMGRFLTFKSTMNVEQARSIADGMRPHISPNVHLELGHSSPDVDYSGNGYEGTLTNTTVADSPPISNPFGTSLYSVPYEVVVSGFQAAWATTMNRSGIIGAR